jgi:hypothetical protein
VINLLKLGAIGTEGRARSRLEVTHVEMRVGLPRRPSSCVPEQVALARG